MLAGVVLDIREGQRCQNRPFFFGVEVGFLTFGKVNGAKIDRFFLGGEGGFLTFGKVNGAKIDSFFFGRRVLDIGEGQLS